jgi:predicted ATPase
MQGKLTELFINTILAFRKEGIDMRIIIETHSETVVSKAGYMIRSKAVNDLKASDIGVYLFEKENETLAMTSIKESSFDNEGFLENWPYDFFDGTR